MTHPAHPAHPAPQSSESTSRDDYDTPWKEALERLLQPFVAFFLPVAHEDIDWSHPIAHLDTELRTIDPEAETGNRRADHLVRVRRHNGEPGLVLIHVEIQSRADRRLAKRMYTYGTRIYDRYDLPVVSLALLGDRRGDWQPNSFGWDLWGCSFQARFPTAQMLDWENRQEELESDPNPFALVVLAHLKTRATRGAPAERLNWKMQLMRLLIERRYAKKEALELFRILDWLMRLPKPEAEIFRTRYDELTKELKMPYVTSIERLAKEEGIQQGQVALLEAQLTRRFGDLPSWAHERLSKGENGDLYQWGERLLDAPTLEAVFADPS